MSAQWYRPGATRMQGGPHSSIVPPCFRSRPERKRVLPHLPRTIVDCLCFVILKVFLPHHMRRAELVEVDFIQSPEWAIAATDGAKDTCGDIEDGVARLDPFPFPKAVVVHGRASIQGACRLRSGGGG